MTVVATTIIIIIIVVDTVVVNYALAIITNDCSNTIIATVSHPSSSTLTVVIMIDPIPSTTTVTYSPISGVLLFVRIT
jgi:hypothetical protein